MVDEQVGVKLKEWIKDGESDHAKALLEMRAVLSRIADQVGATRWQIYKQVDISSPGSTR
jgi:DNA-binding phage protein